MQQQQSSGGKRFKENSACKPTEALPSFPSLMEPQPRYDISAASLTPQVATTNTPENPEIRVTTWNVSSGHNKIQQESIESTLDRFLTDVAVLQGTHLINSTIYNEKYTWYNSGRAAEQ